MRKFFLVCLTLSHLFLCLSACNPPKETYMFPNTSELVESIELIYNQAENGEGADEQNFVIIKELDQAEITSFMEGVYKLETRRGGTPPLWGYGYYIARVTYSNGDVEMLGSINIEFIKAGEGRSGVGNYYFVGDTFLNLFSQYVSIEEYPTE